MTPDGKRVAHDSFETFITRPPFEGLGSTVNGLKRFVENDSPLKAMLSAALAGKKVSRPKDYRKSEQLSLFVPISRQMQRDLTKLREHSPTLHRRVLSGELTLYEAMIEGGLRERTLTVRPKDIEGVARLLRTRLSNSEIAKLRRLL